MSSSHVSALSAPAAVLLGATAVLVTRCAAVPGATAHRQTEPGPPKSPPGPPGLAGPGSRWTRPCHGPRIWQAVKLWPGALLRADGDRAALLGRSALGYLRPDAGHIHRLTMRIARALSGRECAQPSLEADSFHMRSPPGIHARCPLRAYKVHPTVSLIP
jgi:hypothetical protein